MRQHRTMAGLLGALLLMAAGISSAGTPTASAAPHPGGAGLPRGAGNGASNHPPARR
ncbi:hypothetical protein [Streptomyces sp. ERV7]|uniref:hypothetical protein n=1 Tax=Streptomyces sp. ERV7 TaxID=1322334 RepID=UPI00131E231A|nr:hypothetical protein [Streptomyces sp. ERV7]